MTIKGDEELKAGLDHMASGLDEMSQAHRAAARIALEAARSRAPVRTGKLRASGSYGATGKSGQVIFSAPYAGPVHWGVPSRHIPPSLFAIKGVEASQVEWLAVYDRTLQADLDKIGGA